MFRILPALTLSVAALGGAAVAHVQPAPLQAQTAYCRFGTKVLCELREVCTERAFNVSFKNFGFGVGPCLSKVQYHLYYTKAAMGEGSGKGGSEKPTGDDGPGGDSGDGSAA